jgi:hypothetical protein
MTQLIIGVDCATKPSRTGLARGEHFQGRYAVTDLMVCDERQHPVEVVVDWLQDALACVVAGMDYLEGNVVRPRQLDIAYREGWIWFREPARVD